MTGPLVVLGVLSAVGGALNLPHSGRRARGPGALARAGDGAGAAVHPAGDAPRGRPSTSWSAPPWPSACWDSWLGFRATLAPAASRTAARAPAETGLGPGAQPQVLRRRALRRASSSGRVVWLSRVVLWRGVDQGVVDGAAVNGTARRLARPGLAGQPAARPVRSGVYVVLFLVGALWILRAVIR